MRTRTICLVLRASVDQLGGRQPPLQSLDAFSRVYSDAAGTQKLSQGPTRSRFILPKLLREKLGTPSNAWLTVYDDNHDITRGPNVPARSTLFEHFKRNCFQSNRRGLACHLDAILSTAGALPSIPRARLRFHRSTLIDGKWITQWRLTTVFDRTRDNIAQGSIAQVSIAPAALQNLQCNIAEADGGRDSISHCALLLIAVPDQEASKSTTLHVDDVGADDESDYVSEIFAMVVKRFCKEMTFQSRREATATMAEALLHVLKFRTPTLYVYNVKLTIHFGEGGPRSTVPFTAIARWKSSEEGAADRRKEADVVVEQKARGSEEVMEDEECDVKEDEADDQDSVGVSASEPPSGTPRPAEAEDNLASLVNIDPGSGNVRIYLPGTDSWNVIDEVGMHVLQLAIVWDKEHEQAARTLRKLDFTRAFERSMTASGSKGWGAAVRVSQVLAEDIPGNPQITLVLRMPPNQLDHAAGGTESYLDLVIRRRAVRGQAMAVLHVPGSLWCHFHGSVPHGRPESLKATYSFKFTDVGSVEGSILTLAQRLRDAVEAQIMPIVQQRERESIMGVANRCAAAMMQLSHSTDELPRFSSARVKFWSRQNGMMVKRAQSAWNSERHSAESLQQTHEKSVRIDDGVFIALGSNLGDRFAAIESACRKIDEDPDMRIVATSSLFETDPMYVEDQDPFLNGVCQIETQLEPMDLLDRLQAIENDLGRVKIIDKGPRNIDLDIVAYGQQQINTERLIVPHRLMLEREFVLRPMFDVANWFCHPSTRTTIQKHLARLPPTSTPMYPLTPLAPGVDPLRSLDPGQKTLIMSILNVTPDSFSDGGQNQPADIDGLKATVAAHIAAGATIIDIGGQSSRPNAADITAEEELARILPAIEAIKSLPEASKIAISIDTYRAQVAEAAINAGAHIINDISAGLLDPEMLPTVARLGCTYIMMHMRGTPHTMQNGDNTSYPHGVIGTVAAELNTRLDAAQAAGIRRWRIILDPGVGFAKTTDQNLEILRRMSHLRHGFQNLKNLPWLVGSSRKGFIGKITEVEKADERVAGTAVTVAAAVAGKAEIVRVHDVQDMARVVKMADALYKRPAEKKLLKG